MSFSGWWCQADTVAYVADVLGGRRFNRESLCRSLFLSCRDAKRSLGECDKERRGKKTQLAWRHETRSLLLKRPSSLSRRGFFFLPTRTQDIFVHVGKVCLVSTSVLFAGTIINIHAHG